FFEIQHAQPEDTNELFQKLLEDLQIKIEELSEYINSPSWNHPTFYNDYEEHSIQHKEYLKNSSNAIATVLPTEEPEYSLSMGYEHLSTIPETESDEVIKSSVKNLVPIPISAYRQAETVVDNHNHYVNHSRIIRTGKGFSGVETPLFQGMIVAHQANDVADEGAIGVAIDNVHAAATTAEPSIPSPTPTPQPPPPSQELPSTS
nr:hypothetical protein [Tanacetum cinerariifolium]